MIVILPTYTNQGNRAAAATQRRRTQIVSVQSPALALQLGAQSRGMGSIGGTLYNWTPDQVLLALCPNPSDPSIIEDSACDRFHKAQAQLYPAPLMPVTVKPPDGALDNPNVQNPASAEAAQAVIDEQIRQQTQAQGVQTIDFMGVVNAAVEADRARREKDTAANLSWLGWGALGVAGFALAMRLGRG